MPAVSFDPGMTPSLENLVDDVRRLTGSQAPKSLDADAPTLQSQERLPIYLIGLIGGKDVGKTSLIEQLAGVSLGAASHTGEGTRTATAYAHESEVAAVHDLFSRICPDRYDVITHNHDSVRRQVLVDLPDIDSVYEDHVQLTRRMLRHMLYPIWVQSVDKYADQKPQQLLAQVAAGNDPSNFLFCLSKVDHVESRHGAAAVEELAGDFSRRVGKALSLTPPPRVYCVSSVQPQRFDLPALRSHVRQGRNIEVVQRSLDRAAGRRDAGLLAWIDDQDVPARLGRTRALRDATTSLLNEKVIGPIASSAMPRLLDDAGLRGEIAERAARSRVGRWPLINVIDATLAPVLAGLRRSVNGGGNSTATVAGALADLTPSVPSRIQAAFAEAGRLDRQIAELYGPSRPWEAEPASARAADLVARLSSALQKRQLLATDLASRGLGGWGTPCRWALTFGAVLWFPIVQPVLEIVLKPDFTWTGVTRESIWLMIQLLGATYLLKSVGFLAVYLVLLWMAVRFRAGRSARRAVDQIDAGRLGDESARLSRAMDDWLADQLEPLDRQESALGDLKDRIDAARGRLDQAA
jgi:hypothetical protein